ncbi:class D sortase [Ornithinibacillus sp. 4-3]|uniref:Class D sortase n=1 Tax=Ornithinibacillus sp. 4-3 TaxID=3231488 RepID=A0AB39HS98_9BACI
MRRIISILFIVVGLGFVGVAVYQLWDGHQAQKQSIVQAKEKIDNGIELKGDKTLEEAIEEYTAEYEEAFATLEIPKLGKTLPIVEGTDPDALNKGVGHLSNSMYPGQNEQILLSGHRDTVFRNFGELELGDTFIVEMPYGEFTYEIRDTEIVPEDDTTVIREMGEEVLVVTTCYPFHYVGNAPERFVAYAYPVAE